MPRGPKTIKIGDLRIPEPNEVALVLPAIRAAVGRSKLFLTPSSPRRPVVEWRLSESQAGIAEPPWVLLLSLAAWKYWLGMQLKFEVEKGEALFRGASLTILRSALATVEPMEMLRAEWEHRSELEHRRHAQPHWHVATSNEAIDRFHLAMAACWHLGEAGSHYREPSPERVARWIQECIIYTRGQLEVISRA